MIVIQYQNNLIKANFYGELTLSDYRELEQLILKKIKSGQRLNLILDLSDMAGFTLDVAWEDIRFTLHHPHDFMRIAVVTDDQWTAWLAWLGGAFTDADIQHFNDSKAAEAWIAADK